MHQVPGILLEGVQVTEGTQLYMCAAAICMAIHVDMPEHHRGT